MDDLKTIARTLTAPPKGILAADESNASADKRLSICRVPSSPTLRRDYRSLLLDAQGIETYLTGVILFEETLTQTSETGELFPHMLRARGIMPGIKVDQGTEAFEGSENELVTKGLIGLPERLTHYKETYGTIFTKWRAVVRIDGEKLPSDQVLLENARRLAQYARMVQEAGMVPMVEPEVLYEGTHSLVKSKMSISKTVHMCMDALHAAHVDMGAVILKTSMAMSGKETGRVDAPEEVAQATLDALMESIPQDIGGIVFLSGGQTPDQATENLRAIHTLAKVHSVPWHMTFSYARAIQEEALLLWKGEGSNVAAAREAYLARLKKLKAAYA